MIEDLGHHKSTKFTRKEMVVDKALRSLFLIISKKLVGFMRLKSLIELL